SPEESAAAVTTRILTPLPVRYSETSCPPFLTAESLRSRSSSKTLPQSPNAWRVRKSPGSSPLSSIALSAAGVATTCPSSNSGLRIGAIIGRQAEWYDDGAPRPGIFRGGSHLGLHFHSNSQISPRAKADARHDDLSRNVRSQRTEHSRSAAG